MWPQSQPLQGRTTGPCQGAGSRQVAPTSCSSWKSSNMFSMSTKEFWIILEWGKDQGEEFAGAHPDPGAHGEGDLRHPHSSQHYL